MKRMLMAITVALLAGLSAIPVQAQAVDSGSAPAVVASAVSGAPGEAAAPYIVDSHSLEPPAGSRSLLLILGLATIAAGDSATSTATRATSTSR